MKSTIYRQAAIDAICKACQYDKVDYADCPDRSPSSLFCDYMNALRQLPSAQLDGKIMLDKEAILQAGYQGREVDFRIGGRLFAIREKAQ